MANLNVLNLIAEFDTGSGSVHRLLTDGPVARSAHPARFGCRPPTRTRRWTVSSTPPRRTRSSRTATSTKYRIHDRIGMTVELVPYLFGANRRPTGQRGWYSRFRHGARLIDAAAVKVLDA